MISSDGAFPSRIAADRLFNAHFQSFCSVVTRNTKTKCERPTWCSLS